VPPLDPRVPVRQDSGARGLRHVRALGDASGRLARLTSEQHLEGYYKRTGPASVRSSRALEGIPRRGRLARATYALSDGLQSLIDHSPITMSLLDLNRDLDLVLVAARVLPAADRLSQRSSRPLDLAPTRRCLRRRDERRHGVNTTSLNTCAGVSRERAVRDIFDDGITLARRLRDRARHKAGTTRTVG